MALISDFVEVMLKTKDESQVMPSGALKEAWKDMQKIKVALYDTSQMTTTQNVRYDQYDYAAISFYTGFNYRKRNVHRLIIGADSYSVERVNQAGMISYLLLKKVDIHGQ